MVTIQKVVCVDDSAYVSVHDESGAVIAIQPFADELSAKLAMKLLQNVLTEIDVAHRVAQGKINFAEYETKK